MKLLVINLSILFLIASSKGNSIIFPTNPMIQDMLDTNSVSTRQGFRFNDVDNQCSLPSGRTGNCVPLVDCPELLGLLERNGRTSRTFQTLRSRICRFEGRQVFLCCANTKPVIATTVKPTPINTSPILPKMSQCGFSTGGRIIDGEEIKPGSHPWLVGVGYLNNGEFKILCGGTLITRRHVITAAHCFHRRPRNQRLTHVVLGEHSLSKEVRGEERTLLKIKSRKSPGYNSVSHVNDFELLTLERDVKFTPAIRPACLPFELTKRDFTGEEMTVVGWGDTFHGRRMANDVPLAAMINVTPKDVCKEAYRTSPEVPLDNSQFCVGGGTSKDACQGDSGGPLIYNDKEDTRLFYLMGVVSVGVECGNPQFPGIYAYVPNFLTWLRENLS